MSVSVTLPNDLEKFLEMHAEHVGIPVETLLTRAIVDRWDSLRREGALSDREAKLMSRLQTLFPPDETNEYKSLCEQSDSGTLTEQARDRLLALLEIRDHRNAERLEIVADLAALRNLSVRETMAELEIRPD